MAQLDIPASHKKDPGVKSAVITLLLAKNDQVYYYEEDDSKNTVDILDEMAIDDVHHYAMIDISPGEYDIMSSPAHYLR